MPESLPPESLAHTTLESLEVGATPVVRHFLQRLQLAELLQEYLPTGRGRPADIPVPVTLSALVSNLLLARQPLYAIPAWLARRVPEPLGLTEKSVRQFQDDRLGRALDQLYRADRASLLTALVMRAVRTFAIELREFHQDTTTITFSGSYANQVPAETTDRPPLITFGYNKDHRPDLKQLLFSVTVSADGAVPVHCKTYDGNTSDNQVHIETWSFLRDLNGHADFLYVADSKLCTRDNMSFIADRQGRFLTVLPRTRAEDGWFRGHLQNHAVDWQEVRRDLNPRRPSGPKIVYEAVESPQRSSEGYRVLWYRSSQKREEDRRQREQRLTQARAWLEGQQAGRQRHYRQPEEALAAGLQILEQHQATRWLRVRAVEHVEVVHRQTHAGRPGPNTPYQRVALRSYTIAFDEDGATVAADARCDGLFPLVTNDPSLTLAEALDKYKYQPFVEKRHEQLKSVFAAAPVWLKKPERIASLLWLYYVVELLQALLEREVRKRMRDHGHANLAWYPEGRPTEAPTAELVIRLLEGHRRHRLLDAQGQVLRTFYDPVSPAGQQVLELLEVDGTPYGLD